MTDDHHDDRLREALHAEAEAIEAHPALLDRIRAEVSTRPVAQHARRGRILAVAAACILAAGAVAVLTHDRDDDQRVDVSDDEVSDGDGAPSATAPPAGDCSGADLILHPSSAAEGDVDAVRQLVSEDPLIVGVEYLHPSAARAWYQRTTGVTVADGATVLAAGVFLVDLAPAPATEAEIDELVAAIGRSPAVQALERARPDDGGCVVAPDPPVAPSEPDVLALVREDGMLMTVDLATGEQRELFSLGDPSAQVEEGSPYFIEDVELSPDGQWIYYTPCCEPAVGSVFRVPVDATAPPQGEETPSWFGLRPRVSPDGRYVATHLQTDGQHVALSTADGQELDRAPVGDATGPSNQDLLWSPGGDLLALVNDPLEGDDASASVIVFEVVDDALRRREDLDRTLSTPFASWGPDGTVVAVSGKREERLRLDASGHWWLWIEPGGVVTRTSADSGAREPIPGLPRAIAADW